MYAHLQLIMLTCIASLWSCACLYLTTTVKHGVFCNTCWCKNTCSFEWTPCAIDVEWENCCSSLVRCYKTTARSYMCRILCLTTLHIFFSVMHPIVKVECVWSPQGMHTITPLTSQTIARPEPQKHYKLHHSALHTSQHYFGFHIQAVSSY